MCSKVPTMYNIWRNDCDHQMTQNWHCRFLGPYPNIGFQWPHKVASRWNYLNLPGSDCGHSTLALNCWKLGIDKPSLDWGLRLQECSCQAWWWDLWSCKYFYFFFHYLSPVVANPILGYWLPHKLKAMQKQSQNHMWSQPFPRYANF